MLEAIRNLLRRRSSRSQPDPVVEPKPLATESAPDYVAADGLPVPPLDLIYLVVGTRDPVGFIEGGKSIAHGCIVQGLEKNQLDLNRFQSILDFGCGCGRLTRQWKYLTKPRLYGTDYNPVLVDWCRKNLPFAHFDVNNLEPPLKYRDKQFEFIFAGSVFTHFTEELQFAWLDELWRVLMFNGYLMLTCHGDYYAKNLPPELFERYENGEHVVVHAESIGTNACGAYHSARYIRERLTRRFTLTDFIPSGWDTQDMVILRKKEE